MNAVTDEFDIGPLTWVKSEIDLALERAEQALLHYSASAAAGKDDRAQIKFSRTYLHQAQGALTIVGLDGVRHLAEALEELLDGMEKNLPPAGEANIDLAHRCLQGIARYLDDLVIGQANQALRLLPLYKEIQMARGSKDFSAADLFFPDLNARPPRRESLARKMSRTDFRRLLRQQRGRFQRGLLAWLRNPDNDAGAADMLAAVEHIEATQDAASARSFWWVSIGLLSALGEGTLPAEANVKQLCARIDLQIRRLIEGSQNVAERLMREALYFVALSDSQDPTVQLVKQTYRLPDLIPQAESLPAAPQEGVRRRLRDTIAAAEEAWNKFCSGTMQSLPVFKEHTQAIVAVVDQLGHMDYRRLVQAIAAAANWLSEDASRHSEALAMEIATGILLAQNAQENFQHLGKDFAHQVDVTVARIHSCIAGLSPQPGTETPLLDEMSRKAQEKLLVSQVAREIQNNLAQIEQVLDNFFRDASDRAALAELETPFRQIYGALTIMRQDGAVAALHACSEEIKRYASPDYIPQEKDFEHVASELSLIGFFVDAMQSGATDFQTFARQMQHGARGGAEASEETGEEHSVENSVEHEVEQQKRETQSLLGALLKKPDDSGLREELRQNLSSLKSDADLVADTALSEQAKAALTALDNGAATAQIEQAIASLKTTAETPQPSDQTMQLAQASNEEIDAELLDIFIEEAHEVLATIEKNLQTIRSQPHDVQALTTIRRSFHTLKGSGRMVGLKDLGETAWAIEQTLNLWLRQEQEVTFALVSLLEEAKTLFGDWVHHLQSRSATAPEAQSLIRFAESLRRGDTDGDKEEQPSSLTATVVTRFINQAYDDSDLEFAETRIETTPLTPPVDTFLDFPPLVVAEKAAEAIAPASVETIEITMPELAPSAESEDFTESSFDSRLSESETTSETPVDGKAFAGEASPREPSAKPTDASPPEVADKSGVHAALLAIFHDEAKMHLATLYRELPQIEREEILPTPHEMYRAAHTLAGISATVGIDSLNRIGHALENALLRRDSSPQVGSLKALGVVRQAIHEIDLILAALADRRDSQIAPGLIEALDELYPALALAPSQPEGDETSPHPPVVQAEERPAPAPAHPTPAAAAQAAAVPSEVFPFRLPMAVAALPRLQDEIDAQLLPIFLEEAQDLAQKISGQLRAWHSAPSNDKTVHVLGRLLHTLKGSARMVGAMNLGEITHVIEARVQEASRNTPVAQEVIGEIESVFDDVQHIIDRLRRGETLDTSQARPGAEPSPAAGTASPLATDAQTPAGGKPVKVAPPLRERRSNRDRFSAAESENRQASLRVRADLIDRLVNEAGELSIARTRIEGEMRSLKESLLDLTENVIRLRRQLRDIEIQAETQMQSRTILADAQHAGFDPLEFDRFTQFQEITRMMAESVNDVSTVQQNLLKNLDDANAAILAQARLNRTVQQELMSMRMVPFASLADRLYRIVRQTSKDLDKRVNLDMTGGQVELDRSVLDKIAAPLEHMLRNAIAHGIESRAARLTAGKPEIGEISLSLRQESNEVILSLADDGAGLNLERIRQQAIQTGLLDGNDTIGADQLAEMILLPGFSTASEVSQIAGRGIGMDVVKSEVTSLGGRVEISSESGKRTEFRLYIPLTLAVTKALLVRAGKRSYAVPASMIEQVLDLKEAPLNRIREAGQAEWMGYTYPFAFLPDLLGNSEIAPELRRQYWVLLLRSGSRRIAVQVDELMGNQEIVVKNIGPQLARVIGIDGATVLGDGQVVLIINPIALSTRAPLTDHSPLPAAAAQEHPRDEETTPIRLATIMVVDDSLTMRKITGRLLAREGYHVLTAKDGVDALEQLIETVPDVMLVDIEMPRLDGFDLTRNIRADKRLKHIPIIMVTSRTAEKHRNYAFEIGVNHFLGKPFQEEELLALVAGHLKSPASSPA